MNTEQAEPLPANTTPINAEAAEAISMLAPMVVLVTAMALVEEGISILTHRL